MTKLPTAQQRLFSDPAPDSLSSAARQVLATGDRVADASGDHRQASLTDEALAAGLAVLGGALARRHPGRRFVFEPSPGHDCADLVAGRQILGTLPAPQDPHSSLIDRNGLRAAGTADVADEDAVDQGSQD
jgi:hypothetical protein